MKKIYVLYSLFYLVSFQALAQSSYWLQSGGGSGNDESYGLTARNNFIYKTGYYSEYGTFGDALFAQLGAGDIYVSRIAETGEYLWTKQFGGLLADRGICVTTQSNGNVIFGGTITGNVTFGTQQFNTNQGSQDIVVGCLSSDGEVLWTQVFGGNDIDIISDIKTDQDNNIVFSAQFRNSITLGANQYSSGVNPLNNQPSYDLLVVKLNPNGQLLWSKHGRTSRDDQSLQLAISPENEIYMTGIFSDTLHFDNTYLNTSFGMGFLMKMSASGEEQWFRRIWSNVTNIEGLTFYDNKVLLTGNFTGQQKFASNNQPLAGAGFNNSLPNKYYLAAYDTSGVLDWAKTEGSSNPVTVKGLTVTEENRIVLAGQFSCKHSLYSDAYGEGLFLSRGGTDIFMSAFDLSGNRLWAKQIGSKGADEVNALATFNNTYPIISGSYENMLAAPAKGTWDDKPWYVASIGNFGFEVCNDNFYNTYARVQSLGNKDVFIASIADTTRRTLDIFQRPENTCNFELLSGEIVQDFEGGIGCSAPYLRVNLPFLNPDISDIDLDFQWSSGAQTDGYQPTVSGTAYVQVNASATCYSFQDSLTYEIPLITPEPNISTTYGSILSLDPIDFPCPLNLVLVAGDTVTLIGNAVQAPFVSYWSLPNGGQLQSDTLDVFSGGVYNYTIQKADGSCPKTVCIQIWYSTYEVNICEGSNHPFVPQLYWGEILADTISGCPSDLIELNLEDSTFHSQFLPTNIFLFGRWKLLNSNLEETLMLPLANPSEYLTLGDHKKGFFIQGTGPMVVRIEFLLPPLNQLVFASYDFPIFVEEWPQPQISWSLSGLYENVCPRDTAYAFLSSNADGIIYPESLLSLNTSSEPDYFQMLIEGQYSIELRDTNDFGCVAFDLVNLDMSYKTAPEITMNPDNGILCPGGSVELTCDVATAIEWNGPNNDVISNELQYQAEAPGFYSALVTDAEGCVLVSNRVLLRQFLAPNINLSKARMCLGDSISVEIDVTEGDSIQWLPPLSGSNLVQTISDTGTYTIQLYSCNDTITTSFTVEYSEVQAIIEFEGDSIRCAADTFMLSGSSQGLVSYLWMPGENIDPQLEVNQAGAYSLQVTDEYGCFAYDSVSIAYHPAVSPPAAIDSMSICLTDSVWIATSNNESVYWFLNNALLLPDTSGFWFQETYTGQPLQIAFFDSAIACYSAGVQVPIEIKPTIELFAFPDTAICRNDSISFEISPFTLNLASYVWETPFGNFENDSALVFLALDSSFGGNYTLLATANESHCGADTVSFQLTVSDITPPEVITSAPHVCTNQPFVLAADGSAVDSLVWTFMNQNFFSDSISININDSTLFGAVVFLSAINSAGCVVRDTLSLEVHQTPIPPVISSGSACLNDSLLVQVDLNGLSSDNFLYESNVAFAWVDSQLVYWPDSAGQAIALSTFTSNGFCISDTILNEWTVGEIPQFELPDTLVYCLPDNLIAEGPSGFNAYLWSNGSNSIDASIEIPGWYSLVITDDFGCKAIDSLFAFGDYCDAEPTPNVFTPNNDLYNDKFIIKAHGMTVLSAVIFDRWGKLLAEVTDAETGWDGKNRAGDELPSGTYFYVAQAKYINNTMQELKGTIQLLR